MCKRADDCLRACVRRRRSAHASERDFGLDRGRFNELANMTIDETHGLACRDTAVAYTCFRSSLGRS